MFLLTAFVTCTLAAIVAGSVVLVVAIARAPEAIEDETGLRLVTSPEQSTSSRSCVVVHPTLGAGSCS